MRRVLHPLTRERRSSKLVSFSRSAIFLLPLLLLVVPVRQVEAQAPVVFPMTAVLPSGQSASASAAVPVTVTVTVAGTLSAVAVLTQGSANLEYTAAGGGGTCVAGLSYTVGQSCTLGVVFAPHYPGQRHGAVVLEAADGSVLGTTYMEGLAAGSLSVLVPGQMTTVAGDTTWIYAGDGGQATQSAIFLPMGEVTDGAGNLYIADTSNNRVRRVDAVTGTISTVAGDGAQGYSGDAGPGTSAELNSPTALVMDGAGDLYIADSGNSVVRMLCTSSGIITTAVNGYGVGIPFNSAVSGLALDQNRKLYVALSGAFVVLRVDLNTGAVVTVAGTGTAGYSGDGGPATAADFNTPQGLALGLDGSLFIADLNNNVVRHVSGSGIVTTVAGGGTNGLGDGGPPLHAQLYLPAGVAFDATGNMYIADAGNNRIRKVNAMSRTISTLAGNGNEAMSGDGGPATEAQLYGPYSIYLDGQGDLLIGDMFHNRIRRVNGSLAALQYDPIRVGRTSPPQLETIENDGNTRLNLTAPTFVNASLDAATITCVLPSTTPLAQGMGCVLGVAFSPTVLGNSVAGSVTLGSDAGDSPAVVTLTGQVLSVDPTAITLTSSVNPSGLGANVTFTAHVTTQGSNLTGSVQVFDGSTSLGTALLDAGSNARLSTTGLTLGQHTMTAQYSGDGTNAASTSPVVMQSVKQATALSLVASPNPSVQGGSVTLTATATTSGSVPTGSITFTSDGAALGTAAMNASGVATFTVSTLAIGSHALAASYAGDAVDSPSASNTVTLGVKGQASSTTLQTNNATVPVGTAVTFSAQVTGTGGNSGSGTPGGLVTFEDGGSAIGTATLDANGAASVTSTSLAPGAHTITAVYTGDATYAGSTAAGVLETVQQLATSTLVLTSANPTPAGAVVVLTAVVSPSGSTGGAVTGSVSFMNAGAVLGTGTVSAGGVATLSTATLPLGVDTVSAVYAGSVNYAASTSAGVGVRVVQASSATVLGTSLSPSIAEDAVTLTATVTTNGGPATGTVTFLDGGAAIGTGALSGSGVATLTTAALLVGSHGLSARYAGDVQTAGSVSAGLTQRVLLRPTAEVLTSSATSLDGGVQVTLIAVAQWTGALVPTGAVTFQADGVLLGFGALDGEGVATLTVNPQAGLTGVTAMYLGDGTFAGSTSATATIPLGTPPQFTLQASQTALTVARLAHTTVDIVVSSKQGFADTLLFGCAGLPVAATCTFSQDRMPLTANGTYTLHVVVDTGSPLTAGSVARNTDSINGNGVHGGGLNRPASLAALCGLPAGALLGLLVWRGRRRAARVLGAAMLLAAMTGCGSITTHGTPAGAYHFQITGAAQGAGVIESVNMSLTVTP